MMDKIKLYEDGRSSVSRLDAMLNKGEHVAAGLTIWVAVGPSDQEGVPVQITCRTKEVLEALIQARSEDNILMFKLIKSELKRANQWLADLTGDAQ